MQVGDFVVRNNIPRQLEYPVTNYDMGFGKITDIYNNDVIEIEILDHLHSKFIGCKMLAESKYFNVLYHPLSIKPKSCMLSRINIIDRNKK